MERRPRVSVRNGKADRRKSAAVAAAAAGLKCQTQRDAGLDAEVEREQFQRVRAVRHISDRGSVGARTDKTPRHVREPRHCLQGWMSRLD